MEDTRTQKFFQNSLMNLSLFSPFDKQPLFLLHQTPHTHTRKNKRDRRRRNRRKNRLLKGQKMARQHGNSKSRSRTKKNDFPKFRPLYLGIGACYYFFLPSFFWAKEWRDVAWRIFLFFLFVLLLFLLRSRKRIMRFFFLFSGERKEAEGAFKARRTQSGQLTRSWKIIHQTMFNLRYFTILYHILLHKNVLHNL